MSQTPFQQIENFQIGTVQFVSSEAIIVGLNDNAPLSLTLNNGIPEAFPSVNSFLAIRVDDLIIIGQVEWILSSKSPLPKQASYFEEDFVDLPYHTRKLRFNPFGILHKNDNDNFVFERGTDILPPLGAGVEIPSLVQMRAIVESGVNQRVKIGKSLRTGGNDVYIDPDKLFGQHLAILGNTGSGKSCSLTGLIRWSLESAQVQHIDNLDESDTNEATPNARFIVLDPNGEYSNAFSKENFSFKSRIYTVEYDNSRSTLKLPIWLWNFAEWSLFTQATSATQKPLLLETLRHIKSNDHKSVDNDTGEIYQIYDDTPIEFSISDFKKSMKSISNNKSDSIKNYVKTLLARIDVMLSNTRLLNIVADSDIHLGDLLNDYIGENKSSNGCVVVLDLSLVPTEIMHMSVSVIVRVLFEALQRYQKKNSATLPTVLAIDEAHKFIRNYRYSEEDASSALCCQTFEQIAREGRKFGLGLVIASQRPSELSPTVTSQCNSFLLHRITNSSDQEFIYKAVPDNFKGLLQELPSLPSQSAILLGWATELPLLIRINDLPENQRPSSENTEFWNVWTGKDDRPIDWEEIAKDWQQRP